MVKFKGKCAAIEQYEPFKEQERSPFLSRGPVVGRTDGQVHVGRRWLGLAHARTADGGRSDTEMGVWAVGRADRHA